MYECGGYLPCGLCVRGGLRGGMSEVSCEACSESDKSTDEPPQVGFAALSRGVWAGV